MSRIVRRKPWSNDLEILERLRVVSGMMIQGAKAHEIAKTTDVSLATAYRDIGRVYELWRAEAQGDIVDCRNRSVAVYREIQMYAWEQWNNSKKGQGAKPQRHWLDLVKDCEDRIARLEGSMQPDSQTNVDLAVSIRIDDFSDEIRKLREYERGQYQRAGIPPEPSPN